MKKLLQLKTMLLFLIASFGGADLTSAYAEEVTLSISSYASSNSWENGTAYSELSVNSDIKATSKTGGNNGKYYSSNYSWRHYEGDSGEITISTTSGTLNSITFSYASGNSGVLIYDESNVASGTECTAVSGETSATFSVGHSSGTKNGNVQITSIVVNYTPAGGGDTPATTVFAPVFDPVGGTYTSVQSVGITCETEGATIHYTTNGEEPTESDATYSSAVSITTSGTVLKAKAFKDGMTASSVSSATYTIKPNAPTVTGGTSVTISGDDGLTFYYTIDGSAPTSSSTEYTETFTPTDGVTVKAIAYDAYGNSSAVTSLKFKSMPLCPKNYNSNYYVKVTDVSLLENGDAVLIVNESANVALGPQSGNNCPGKDITISDGVITNKGDAQKLVLVKKTEKIDNADTEVFYFYTGNAYLYAASSSKNYLKSENIPDDDNNARATVSFSSGNAVVTFTGTYTHNVVMFNPNNGSPLFSCYTSTQTGMENIQIYKEVPTATISINEACTDGAGNYFATYSNSSAFVVPSGLTVSEVLVDKKELLLENYDEGDIVPANTGVLVSATSAGNKTVVLSSEAGTSKLGDDNCLRASGSGITASEMSAADAGCKFYRLTMHNGTDIGFWWGAADGAAFDIAANKAYLAVPTADAARIQAFWFEDEVNGIDNPQLSTLNSQPIYSLSGQRVEKAKKGLYIVNGKKCVIR